MAGGSNYGQMRLPQQLALIQGEQGNVASLQSGATMWRQAAQTVQQASTSLSDANNNLTGWTDSAGGVFKGLVGESLNSMSRWEQLLGSAGPQASTALNQLVQQIPAAAQVIAQLNQEAQELQAAAAVGGPTAASAAVALLVLQQQGGRELQKVADLYNQASQALQPVQSGPNWAGAGQSGGGRSSSVGGGTVGAGGGSTGSTGGAAGGSGGSSGGDSSGGGSSSGASGSGQSGSPDSSATGGSGQDAQSGGDPSLSGTATMTAPTLPTDPNLALPPVATPPAPPDASIAALPIMPPALGGGRGAGGGGLVRRAGGVPGVQVGGPKQIPQAAKPVAAGEPVANAAGPDVPAGESAPGTSGGGTAGGGLIPPMGVPMTGGAGLGGAASTRPTKHHSARRDGGSSATVPGVPAALRGKAGRVDPLAFPPLARPSRRDPAADIATVQLLDEQMWQVGSADAGGPPTY